MLNHMFVQHQLSSSCDEITSLQNDGYMLQEKECLRGEWKTLEGQRSIFERERKNFTEAAIRLSHEVFQKCFYVKIWANHLHTWSQASRINYCSNKAQNGTFTGMWIPGLKRLIIKKIYAINTFNSKYFMCANHY